MALIRIEAGALSFQRDATNSSADRIVTACARAWGYQGSVADKASVLDFFGQSLIQRLQEIAGAEEVRAATRSAHDTTAASAPTWSSQ